MSLSTQINEHRERGSIIATNSRLTICLQVIKTNILASRAKQYELSFKNSMFTPRLYKPIAITCGLMFFQRFSGANAFNYYAVLIFRQTLGGMNPHGATIAIGFVQLLASLLSGISIILKINFIIK